MMQSPAGSGYLAQPKAIVEPIFAVFREHIGVQRFLVSSSESTKAEWRWGCKDHKLRKFRKFWGRPRVLVEFGRR